MRTKTIPFFVVILLFLVASVSAQEAATPSFTLTFTTIDASGIASGAHDTRANGINARGDIVGRYVDGSGAHGFLLSRGDFTTIDLPGCSPPADDPDGPVRGINDRGEIVGSCTDSRGTHGFLLTPPDIVTLIDVPGSSATKARGINNDGDIVGQFTDMSGDFHGFALSRGEFATIDCGLFSANQTVAQGINDHGDIVGNCTTPKGAMLGSFLLSKGRLTGIAVPVPGSDTEDFDSETEARGINDLGQIVGSYRIKGVAHSFLLMEGVFTAIDDSDGVGTQAHGIDALGDVVGFYANGEYKEFGFLASK
jgi:uncharacterized membrane protein